MNFKNLMQALAEAKKLLELNLEENLIGIFPENVSNFFNGLAKIENLTFLNIKKNQIAVSNELKDDFAEILISKKKLTKLNICQIGLGKDEFADIKSLTNVFETNTKITELKLTVNRLDLKNFGYLKDMITKNNSIETLHVNNCNIDSAKMSLLCNGIK